MARIWKTNPTVESLNGIHEGTACEHLGVEFTEVGDDYMIARIPVDERTRQPYGIIHGGVSMVLAETLGSCAGAACIDPATQRVYGQEINGNHLRPATEGYVTGTVRPIHIGRKSSVWSIEMRNDAGKMTCISRMTMAVVDWPPTD
ncbi:MAG: hotdog fold thioesterase [Pseudomonadota bacterium]